MANLLSIKISIDGTVSTGQNIVIPIVNENGPDFDIAENTVNTRTSAGQWGVGGGTNPVQVSDNLADALIADYVNGGVLLIPISVLKLPEETEFFIDFTEFGYSVDNPNIILPTNVSIIVTPEVQPSPTFEITGTTVSQAGSDVCNNIRLTLQVTNGTAPYQISVPQDPSLDKVAANESELWIDILRDTAFKYDITITDDNSDSDTVQSTIVASGIISSIDITESLAGATVVIQAFSSPGNADIFPVYEYSINGSNYTSGNSFSNITPGNYTAYLRDNYGCVKTEPFTVEGVAEERPAPFFDISKVNALRLADLTLTNRYDALWRKRKFTNLQYFDVCHTYEKGDVVTTQIRSSYRDITATLKDKLGNDILTYPVVKEIENIGQEDERSANLIGSQDSSKTYIYFDGTSISLPESWMIAGLQVSISGASAGTLAGTYIVSKILFDSRIGKDVMVIDVVYPYGQEVRIVTLDSSFDIEPWDVYEFNSVFAAVDPGLYYLEVVATDTDPNYTKTEIWQSENICIKETWEDSVLLEYQDTDNSVIGDIIPGTGIVHKLRLYSRFFAYGAAREKDLFTTDTGNTVLKKQVNKRTIVLEGRFPDFIDEKIGFAASHESIWVDSEQFRPSEEEQESENKIDERNPFVDTRLTLQAINTIVKTDTFGIVSNTDTVLGNGQNVALGVFE
jgi:hypothetical protein